MYGLSDALLTPIMMFLLVFLKFLYQLYSSKKKVSIPTFTQIKSTPMGANINTQLFWSSQSYADSLIQTHLFHFLSYVLFPHNLPAYICFLNTYVLNLSFLNRPTFNFINNWWSNYCFRKVSFQLGTTNYIAVI